MRIFPELLGVRVKRLLLAMALILLFPAPVQAQAKVADKAYWLSVGVAAGGTVVDVESTA